MRLSENIEKSIKTRKPHITTGSNMDKRILDDSFAAMDETIRAKSAQNKPNICKIIVQSKITKLAAAAVIILAISFFIVHRGPGKHADTPAAKKITKSRIEMMTELSLTVAYRKGGIEAVEEQCKQAFKPIGPRPRSLSVEQILAEFNDNGKR